MILVRADSTYQEISDELQWDLNKRYQTEDSEQRKRRPELRIRIIMRTYATSSGLPFIKDRRGVGIYAAVNLIPLLIFIINSTLSG
jgi:hypothetical protein